MQGPPRPPAPDAGAPTPHAPRVDARTRSPHGWHRLRPDTLFGRLLLAQLLTVLAVVVVLGLLFYLERNLAVSRLVALRWAPVLRAAVAAPERVPLAGDMPSGSGPWRRSNLPPLAVRSSTWLPRLQVLQQTLREQGLPVHALALSRAEAQPIVWLGVTAADGTPLWLGFADEVLEPRFPARLILALALATGLILAGSAWTARRLGVPLARLRERMVAHTPGAAPPPHPPLRGEPAPTVELAEIEHAWQQLAERLAAHEAERQLLLAGISHDLRSPLARVRLAAELLPDAPGVAERRAAIVRNVEVVDRLLQSFLDLVRADSVALDEAVDLVALARQVLLRRGDSAIALQAPPSLQVEGCNALTLERALNNLLDNAQHHGAAPVVLRLGRQGASGWLEVQDAGPGIAEAERVQVLRAFARGDRSRGRPGAGLGLALVATLARRMGGDVHITGGPGALQVRMSFALTKPARSGAAAPDAPSAQTTQAPQPGQP